MRIVAEIKRQNGKTIPSPFLQSCWSLCFFNTVGFVFQERLNYIGPEEFVQAFVQKDPLDNDKVMGLPRG